MGLILIRTGVSCDGRVRARGSTRAARRSTVSVTISPVRGRLAGGIAHDFNNVLSVVLGYAEMVLGDLKVGDPLREDVNEIHKAGMRAPALAFAARRPFL